MVAFSSSYVLKHRASPASIPVMQCPHCQGDIPSGSQFCGICGRNIVPDYGHSPSLFDIPVSTGAKRIRIGMIVVLNIVLVGTGFAFLREYLHKREVASTAVVNVSNPSKNLGQETVATSPNGQLTTSGDGGVVSAIQSEQTHGMNPGLNPGGTGLNPGGTGLNPGGTGLNPGTTTGSTPIKRVDAGVTSSTKPEQTGREPSKDVRPGRAVDAGRTIPAQPAQPTKRRVDAGVSTTPPPRPSVDAGRGSSGATPSRTPEEEERIIRVVASKVSRVVASHQGQLGRCYQNAQKITTPDNPIEGTIKVQFSIQNDGSAKSVRVNSNSTGSASLGKCLTGLVRNWTFPSSQGEPLDFQWPFEFQAPK